MVPLVMIIANGSILVVGGETSNNGDENPTFELLPKAGGTIYLDFLDRTKPFNLYPFITVVPSGIFIAYFNEARILDEITFETIKTLPNMPGAMNDSAGDRRPHLPARRINGLFASICTIYRSHDCVDLWGLHFKWRI